MAVHCPECGFVNPEGSNYCQKCGAYLGHAEGGDEPTTMTYTVDETGDMQPVDIDEVVSPSAAKRRSLMPVRVVIHSSLVSTIPSRSLLVRTFLGT